MIAGWIRTEGQVADVVMGRSDTWLNAPIMDQTNGDWPCSPIHGW
jgi:hypothetical protein